MKRISGKIIIENKDAFFESSIFKKKFSINNLGKVSPDNAFCFLRIKGNPRDPGLKLAFNSDNVIGNAEDSKITIIEVIGQKEKPDIVIKK